MGAFALASAGALLAVPSSVAAAGPPASFDRLTTAARPCQVTLPGGLEATVTEQGGVRTARLSDPAKAKGPVATYWSDGHQFLVPASAPAARDRSAYDTTELARRACGTDTPTTVAARSTTRGKGGSYSLARLTIKTLDGRGDRPDKGAVLLTNLDDNTLVRRTYDISTTGVHRLVVPVGRYTALLWCKDDDGTQRLTFSDEFSVTQTGDAHVTLDGRTSTVEAPVPAPPRPATPAGSSFTVYRGDGTGLGAEHGLWFQMLSLDDPLRILVNPGAGPAKHGKLTFVRTYDFVSPGGAGKPYAYHVANVSDRTSVAYPTKVDPATLATVDRTYTAPGTASPAGLVASTAAPAWAARTGYLIPSGIDLVSTGTVRTEYFSAQPDLTWQSVYEDGLRPLDITEPSTVYRRGQHLTEAWGAGALHPNGPVTTTGAVTFCGACASRSELLFALRPDGDNVPGSVGTAPGPIDVSSVTLKRDGELYASGEEGLDEVGVTVPAGRARYELNLTTRRTAPGTRVSPRTDTTWTFTADPGHGKAVPGNVLCAGLADGCTALPLLYAYTGTDADRLDQVRPGRHTLALSVLRQQYSAPATVSGAEVSVSYDEGAHWRDLRVHGTAGDFTADYTVPAGASGHTVSFRLSAWDSAGSRIDQDLPGAYLVP